MDSDKNNKRSAGRIAASFLFVAAAGGFAFLGINDMISGRPFFGSMVPDGILSVFHLIELGLAAVFLMLFFFMFFKKPEQENPEDDLSDFENNVFNRNEKRNREVSKRYEQPSNDFPESISDEYKPYIKKKTANNDITGFSVIKAQSSINNSEDDISYISNMDTIDVPSSAGISSPKNSTPEEFSDEDTIISDLGETQDSSADIYNKEISVKTAFSSDMPDIATETEIGIQSQSGFEQQKNEINSGISEIEDDIIGMFNIKPSKRAAELDSKLKDKKVSAEPTSNLPANTELTESIETVEPDYQENNSVLKNETLSGLDTSEESEKNKLQEQNLPPLPASFEKPLKYTSSSSAANSAFDIIDIGVYDEESGKNIESENNNQKKDSDLVFNVNPKPAPAPPQASESVSDTEQPAFNQTSDYLTSMLESFKKPTADTLYGNAERKPENKQTFDIDAIETTVQSSKQQPDFPSDETEEEIAEVYAAIYAQKYAVTYSEDIGVPAGNEFNENTENEMPENKLTESQSFDFMWPEQEKNKPVMPEQPLPEIKVSSNVNSIDSIRGELSKMFKGLTFNSSDE